MQKKEQPVNDLHATEARWFAVQTRAKSEKFVWRTLLKKGIEGYLPLMRLMRQYQRSKRIVELPLIPCYVFVRITRNQYVPVLETENVVGFVKLNRDLIAIPEAELELIRKITLENGLDVTASPEKFSIGDPVEIAAGTLCGVKGLIFKQAGKRTFQVALDTLGITLLITVDAVFLEKTGSVTS